MQYVYICAHRHTHTHMYMHVVAPCAGTPGMSCSWVSESCLSLEKSLMVTTLLLILKGSTLATSEYACNDITGLSSLALL